MGCCQAVWQFSKHSVVIIPNSTLSLRSRSLRSNAFDNELPHLFLSLSPASRSEPLSKAPSLLFGFFFFSFLSSSCPTDSQLPGASLHKPQLFKVNMPRQFNFSNPHTSEPLKLQGASLKGRISRLLQRTQRRSAKCLERGKER